MKIVITQILPPIPTRGYDWCAYDDETYEGSSGQPVGHGATAKEALDDLLEQINV